MSPKENEKKRNINNDLAVLPSPDMESHCAKEYGSYYIHSTCSTTWAAFKTKARVRIRYTAQISFPERIFVSAYIAHISFIERNFLSVCSHSTLLTLSTMVLSHLIPSYIPASFLARSPTPSVVIPWSSSYPPHDLEKPAHNLASPQ